MCVSLCVYLHVPVPVSSTASVQCTMVVCEETTPGKLPLDHAVAGAKVPLNTLYYTTDGYNYIMWSPALTSRSNKARAKRGRSIGVFINVCVCICACVFVYVYVCRCV